MVVTVPDVAESFLIFLRSSLTAFLLVSQTFSPRLTNSRHLFLSCARYTMQLEAIPKDSMETTRVSLKSVLWPPWEHLL